MANIFDQIGAGLGAGLNQSVDQQLQQQQILKQIAFLQSLPQQREMLGTGPFGQPQTGLSAQDIGFALSGVKQGASPFGAVNPLQLMLMQQMGLLGRMGGMQGVNPGAQTFATAPTQGAHGGQVMQAPPQGAPSAPPSAPPSQRSPEQNAVLLGVYQDDAGNSFYPQTLQEAQQLERAGAKRVQ